MKKKLFKTIALLMLVVMILGTGGCASKANETSSAKATNTDIEEYAIPDATGNWGAPTPYGLIPRGPGFIRMSYVFDSLIWKDEKGDFIPALAKEWAYNEEENTYTFELQETAKWHDGEAITAKDVTFTIEYMKKHPLPWLNLKPIEKVTAIEENKVEFKLKEKWAPFYAHIAGCMPILPEHIYKEIKNPEKLFSEEQIIGSGPFKLAHYNAEKGEYVFEAFDDYYQGCPKVKKLKFFKMNPQMQPKALLQGQVDAIFTNGDAKKLFKGKDINVISDIGMVTKVAFNHHKAPFDEKTFRHAMAYFINREDIVDIAHRGHAFKGNTGIFPRESAYFEKDVEQYKYNPEKGASILEKLGYKKEGDYYKKDGDILSFTVLGNERVKRDVDMIVEQLNHEGIKAEAIYKDRQTADQSLNNWDFDISVVECGAIGDPIFLNREILGKGFTSDRYYKSEKMSKLLKEQLLATNIEERKNILKEFQKVYAEELPAYHIYFSEFVFAYNDKANLYFTNEGVSIGIPLALNKMIFVK
ncbi:MAG: ABC transporter substrate-binding protein [Marinisporobacter sp.]|jgi:peptide/nickel transport system substrate-binding protein|nr:ABC transporter substrate-binding protein [Marinisporobacter sp.]